MVGRRTNENLGGFVHPWNDTDHRRGCMLLLLAIVELRSDMIVGGSAALSTASEQYKLAHV